MLTTFRDRADAGRKLAEKLAMYGGRRDVLVLALPRGGVPVGFEVARALERRSMCSSCGNWVCRVIKSLRWVPSPRAEPGCSTTTWLARWRSRTS